MIQIIKEITLEVSKPNLFQAIVAKQYDMNTRFLKATLVDGKDIINIPASSTATVVINAERKDGQSKSFDGVINEDGTVTVPLHSWMLELDGTVVCDVSVIDTATDDNKKLTTTSFDLLVEKAAYGGADITSDPQYDILVQLIEDCQEALDNLSSVDKKEDKSNKLTSIESVNNPNEQYPSFSALDEFVQDALSRFAEDKYLESQRYKSVELDDDHSGHETYPSSKAVVDYVKTKLAESGIGGSGVSEDRVIDLIVETIISESLETAYHKLKTINEEELEEDDEYVYYPSAKATVAYVNGKIGDIETALDELHAYAQALASGGVE